MQSSTTPNPGYQWEHDKVTVIHHRREPRGHHIIHSGAVSIEKDKYLTLAHSLKTTRSSHSAQYCRYQTYSDLRDSDALKNSFSPNYSTDELFHRGIVFLLRWSIPRLLRSLGRSSFSHKHSRKIIFFFFKIPNSYFLT